MKVCQEYMEGKSYEKLKDLSLNQIYEKHKTKTTVYKGKYIDEYTSDEYLEKQDIKKFANSKMKKSDIKKINKFLLESMKDGTYQGHYRLKDVLFLANDSE